MLLNVCLGLNFREGVVTRGDFSKHSTVNFFVTDKFNQFTQGNPCLLSRSCVISYFQLRLRFCIFPCMSNYSRKLNLCILKYASCPCLSLGNVCGLLRIAHQKIILAVLIFYVYRSPLFISQAFQSSLLNEHGSHQRLMEIS